MNKVTTKSKYGIHTNNHQCVIAHKIATGQPFSILELRMYIKDLIDHQKHLESGISLSESPIKGVGNE